MRSMPFLSQRLLHSLPFRSSTFFPSPPATEPGLRHPGWVVLWISTWMGVVCNVPLWRELMSLNADGGAKAWAFMAAFLVVIIAGNAALLALLAWRWTLKPAATLLVLMAAFGAYFMLAYGIAIDASMLTNVLQTNVKEAGDLLNWRLPLTVGALAVPPLVWLARQKVRPLPALKQGMHNGGMVLGALALAVCSVLLVFQTFASTMRNHTQLRYLINPLNSIYALGNLATKPLRMDTSKILPLGRDAQLGASYAGQSQPPLLVLVLGETGRAGNFAINGYGRPTTPELSARKDLINLQNAWSCGTSTAASVPCMFSHLGRSDYESRKANYESLIDVLQHAGLAVLWIDNQSGCKGVCDRVTNTNTSGLEDSELCPSKGECLDAIMLKNLDQRLAQLPAEQRQRGTVIVMHQMGSHGPAYFKRSAAARKPFQPECTSTALQECARETVVNAYDNSIVETDHFLGSVLKWLETKEKQAQPAMIYVADHGESLGENNIYLHGLPYSIAPDVQKHVPWINWLSPAMQTRLHMSTPCLQEKLADQRITHDHYFHSVLGLMDVKTSAYKPELDMFAGCHNSGNASTTPAKI